MGYYLELAKKATLGLPLGGAQSSEPARTDSVAERTPQVVRAEDDSREDDAYHRLARRTLRELCQPDYPPDMITWLAEASPRLYTELTGRLLDEVHELWSRHAPLKEFQAALDKLLRTHHVARELYAGHLATKRESRAAGLQDRACRRIT